MLKFECLKCSGASRFQTKETELVYILTQVPEYTLGQFHVMLYKYIEATCTDTYTALEANEGRIALELCGHVCVFESPNVLLSSVLSEACPLRLLLCHIGGRYHSQVGMLQGNAQESCMHLL